MGHLSEGFMKEVALEFLPEGGGSRTAWPEVRGKSVVAMEEP